ILLIKIIFSLISRQFQYVSSLLCEHNLLSSLTVCEHNLLSSFTVCEQNSLDIFVLSFFAFLLAGLNFSPSKLLLKPVLYTNVIMAGSLFPSSSIPPTITFSTTLSHTYRSNVSITSFCSNTFLKANKRFLIVFSSSKFDKDFSFVCTFLLISCISELYLSSYVSLSIIFSSLISTNLFFLFSNP